MNKKYCVKCLTEVESFVTECPDCATAKFFIATPSELECDCKLPIFMEDKCANCLKPINRYRFEFFDRTPPKVSDQIKAKELSNLSLSKESKTARKASGSSDISISSNSNENSINQDMLRDLIRAQDRTTHAVRAFVRFLFIQLSAITFAVTLWNISNLSVNTQQCIQSGSHCSGNPLLQFLAAVVWIGGVIWSSNAGWEELAKSNIK